VFILSNLLVLQLEIRFFIVDIYGIRLSISMLKWLCAVLVKYSSVLHYAKGIKNVPPLYFKSRTQTFQQRSEQNNRQPVLRSAKFLRCHTTILATA